MTAAHASPDLAEATERFLLYGPAPSPSLRYLMTEGATVTMGAHPDPNANRVGLVDVTAAQADDLIDDVLRGYHEAGHGSMWFVSPSSRPADLGERLLARGLTHDPTQDMAGMVLRPLPAEPALPRGPEVHSVHLTEVRGVDLTELRENAHLIADGFGSSLDSALATLDMYAHGAAPGFEFVYYLAFENGKAVAQGTGMVDHERRVTLLGGSATLPAHRGRGHYRALVAARIADAARRGSEAVVVHARRDTSAPILARLGFREIMAIEKYVMEATGG